MDVLLPLCLVYDTKIVQVQRAPQFHFLHGNNMPELQELF